MWNLCFLKVGTGYLGINLKKKKEIEIRVKQSEDFREKKTKVDLLESFYFLTS